MSKSWNSELENNMAASKPGIWLTLAILQTAVISNRTKEFKDKDSHCYHGQAHNKHHHPNCRAVWLWEERET